ncbi:MAG: ion transporter [Pseudomonadota bacterium]
MALRERIRRWIEAPRFQQTIITLIVINAITLGMETSPAIMGAAGPLILRLDSIILAVFVVEIVLRLYVHRLRFFRDPWSVFDFVVVGIALLPSGGPFSVLRALRVLRILRLVSAVPSMRMVVRALVSALPGLGSIFALLALIFYVSAVMATKLFGEGFPEWFGSLGASLYTLFQIMTLESWSMGIVRPVMDVYPAAWIFFVIFILVATFTMLNLFIAVVVNAMQSHHEQTQGMSDKDAIDLGHDERAELLLEVRALRREVAALREGSAGDEAPPAG